MADPLTDKQIREIEKSTEDLTRSLNKARREIEKSTKETNAWFDATKAVQSATEGLNKSQEKQRSVGQQILKNKEAIKHLEEENAAITYRSYGMLFDIAALQQKIRDEAAIATNTTLDAAIRNAAIRRKQELEDREVRMQGDIQENNSRIAGNERIINSLKSQDAALKAQARSLTQLTLQERARKKEAEILQQVNERVMKPLIGDSKEFGKITKFTTDMLKGGLTANLAILEASIERFKELDKAAGDFRDTTKLLVTQTMGIEKAAREVNVQMANLGVGIEEAYKAAGALTNQFQVVGLVTKGSIANLAQMSANLGISVENAAKFKGLFESIAKLSGTTADDTIKAASALAVMGGVAPDAVIKDMAEASGETLSFLAKSPMQLIRATVEARRLGTTVNSIAKSARGFLNFQESINDELNASALLGRALNFQEARAAAYAGDVVKSRELAMKQIAKAGDFTKLNVYQQEALAKAAGMTVEEVIKQQNQEKMLAALKNSSNAEDRAMFAEYEAMTKKMKADEKAAQGDLVTRGREMAKQQLRQSEMNKLTNAFKAIWTDISDALVSIAQAILPPIMFSVRLIASVFRIIAAFVRGLLSPLAAIGKLFGFNARGATMMESALVAVNKVMDFLVPAFEWLGEAIGWAVVGFAALLKSAQVLGKIFQGTRFGAAMDFLATKLIAIRTFVIDVGNLFARRLFNTRLVQFFANGLRSIGQLVFTLGRQVSNFGGIFSRIGGIIQGVGVRFMTISRNIRQIGTGVRTLSQILIRAFQPVIGLFSWIGRLANIIRTIFTGTSAGAGVLARVAGLITRIFTVPIRMFGLLSRAFGLIGRGVGFFGRFAGIFTTFGKAIPVIGWIITGVTVLWELGKKLFAVWSNDNLSFGEKIIESLRAVPEAIFDAIVSPFIDIGVWILNLFGVDIAEDVVDSVKSWGKKIFSYLTNPFLALYDFAKWIFKDGILDGILAGIKSIANDVFSWLASPFVKVFEWLKSVWLGQSPSLIGKMIVDGIKSIGSMLFNALTWPFRKAWAFVSGLFSRAGGGSIVGAIMSGIKFIGNFIIDGMLIPFKFVGNMVSMLFSGDGSLIGGIIDGLKSLASTALDILMWPFKTVLNFVSKIFGGDGDIGTTIVDGLKSVVGFVYDVLVSPFKQLISFAQKIPIVGKLFGGGKDTAAEASKQVQEQTEKKVPVTTVEIQNIGELKDSIDALTEAISEMSYAVAPTVNVSNNNDAVIEKLDELITLLSNGAIGVNLDGMKVSRALAQTS